MRQLHLRGQVPEAVAMNCPATTRQHRRHGSPDYPLSMRVEGGHVPKHDGEGRLRCALCGELLEVPST